MKSGASGPGPAQEGLRIGPKIGLFWGLFGASWEAHMGLPSLRNHEIRALRARPGPARAQKGLPRAWAQALGPGLGLGRGPGMEGEYFCLTGPLAGPCVITDYLGRSPRP